MDQIESLIFLLGEAALLAQLARVVRIPYPIFLVLGGLALGFAPGLPTVEIPPEVIFVVFLPPLLNAAGFFSSPLDLRAHLRAISLLAVGLVLATIFAVAAAAHFVVGLSWPLAFVLGAILSPTDPAAAAAGSRPPGARGGGAARALGVRARGAPPADGPRGGRGDLPPPRRARASRHGRRRREPHKRRHGPRGVPAGRGGRVGGGGLLAHRGRPRLPARRRGRHPRRPRPGLHRHAPLEPAEGRLDPDNLLRPDPLRRLHPRGGDPARLRHPRRGHLRPRAGVEVAQALRRRLHAHPGPRVLGRAGLCAGGDALRPARPATPLDPREPRGVHGTGGPVLRRSGLRCGVGGAPGLLLYGALPAPRLRSALPQQVPARPVAGVPGDELERDAGRGLVGGGPHRPRPPPLPHRPAPAPPPHARADAPATR